MPRTAPKTRFACVAAARNEEAVIANLVHSLRRQNYPPELFDIIVAPNNCTDGTARTAQAACRLCTSAAFRRSEGRFLAEGRKLCPELCRGAELETLFYTKAAAEKCPELANLPGEHYSIEEHVADKLADVGTHQGVFGIFRTPVHTLDQVRPGGRYLALERVQDPGNVGTLLRSAAAFGFDGVLLSEGCASPFAPKTLRASMGAAVRVPVMEVGAMPAAIAQLRDKGLCCLAAALYQSQPLSAAPQSPAGGLCVVVGSEGQGLTQETIDACSGTVRIPMTDRVESLNAGVAGSVLLWHFRGEGL